MPAELPVVEARSIEMSEDKFKLIAENAALRRDVERWKAEADHWRGRVREMEARTLNHK